MSFLFTLTAFLPCVVELWLSSDKNIIIERKSHPIEQIVEHSKFMGQSQKYTIFVVLCCYFKSQDIVRFFPSKVVVFLAISNTEKIKFPKSEKKVIKNV